MRLSTRLSLVLALVTSPAFCAPSGLAGATSPLNITQPTLIPGETLKPGEYSISVVDQLADRMIVRIDSKSSTHHSIFLGVPAPSSSLGGDAGAVFWHEGVSRTSTLRGFNFADGRGVEFVFAKAEAAALAKTNSARVVAIDPQSEGRAALKNLSQDELQVVNLWMLSLTTTGADSKTPAILAQRYEAPPQALPEVSHAPQTVIPPTQVATVEMPPNPAPSAPPSRPSGTRKAVVPVLPHTAGVMPLIWLTALFALFGVSVARLARTRYDA